MQVVEKVALVVVSVLLFATGCLVSYRVGVDSMARKAAMSQIPSTAQEVWAGLVTLPNGRKAHGHVYEAHNAQHQLVRYIVPTGSMNPVVVFP